MRQHLRDAKRSIEKAIGELPPKDAERTDTPIRMKYRIPPIKEIAVSVKTRGFYQTKNARAEGIVVHYTAGRRGSLNAAENTLRYLASRGLGCLVMDNEGVILKARNQDFEEWASHAGRSEHKDRTWVSRYYMGMEICCAGLLNDYNEAWFGQKYDQKFVRSVEAKDNVKAGKYLKYSKKQVASLINFCLWQIDTNQGFLIENIVGHDEVAPDRKSDPGGSLNWPMPEFRQKVQDIVDGKIDAITDPVDGLIWSAP